MDVQNHLNMYNAVFILIVNILLPGLGTILSAKYVTTLGVVEMQE